jgi:CheY-like chemotaxis protein
MVDYQVAQGKGLHLLQRLRQLDPVILIVAISNVAAAAVAGELVHAGADDYFDKRGLTTAALNLGVGGILRRADTIHRRMRCSVGGAAGGQMIERLLDLGKHFADQGGIELAQNLDALATEARQAGLRAPDVLELYRSACVRMGTTGRPAKLPAHQILRPLMLELLVRVLGDSAEHPVEEMTGGLFVR